MKQSSKKLKAADQNFLMKSTAANVEVVLDDELRNEIPLTNIYAGVIHDKKLIRNLILDLNRLLPVLELQHLKRVNKNKIILCLCEDKTEEDVLSLLEKLGFNTALISHKLEVHKVLKYAPKTREQFLSGNKYWPTNFHEDKYLESLLSNTIFSTDEINSHKKWMRTAIEAANRSELKIGTVIIDPIRNELLAVASDARNEHPIKHSVMVAIDLVAHGQGGGAWHVHSADYFRNSEQLQISQVTEDIPYLCTGYYVYTTREPCIMCAMALIHSRVKRLFYSVPSSTGALGTLLKIHRIKNLNHHYEVFKGLLSEEVTSFYHN